MSDEPTLRTLRLDFEKTSNRAVSLPISGAIMWSVVSIASLLLNEYSVTLLLLFATGAILPMALAIAKFRNEKIISSVNPLSKLMGFSVLMVNLLWAIHIPLMMKAPQFVPLSVAIGLGLHWIVYSWVVQHPVGIIHAIMRTLLCVLVWLFVPVNTLTFISTAVVGSYAVSIYLMLSRDILSLETD